jgi:hypothetical protein
MKGTRHSEEQIIAILKQGEAGLNCALNALRRYRARGDFATPLPGGNDGERRVAEWGRPEWGGAHTG